MPSESPADTNEGKYVEGISSFSNTIHLLPTNNTARAWNLERLHRQALLVSRTDVEPTRAWGVNTNPNLFPGLVS